MYQYSNANGKQDVIKLMSNFIVFVQNVLFHKHMPYYQDAIHWLVESITRCSSPCQTTISYWLSWSTVWIFCLLNCSLDFIVNQI